MASFQDVADKRQHRYRRRTPATEDYEWESRRAESRHSLPYRIRQPEIQKSGRRRPKHSSHPSRTAEDLAIHSMPPPVRLLTRSATTQSRGRLRYEDDGDDDEDEDDTTEDDDEDEDEEIEKERLRGRALRGRLRSSSRGASRSKSRVASRPQSRGVSRAAPKVKLGAQSGVKSRAQSRVKPRATSRVKSRPASRSSHSTESITIPTPTRSSYMQMRSPPSAPSLRASSEDSSDESDDLSDFTQDRRLKTRTLKERMNGTPDSEPAPNPTNRSRSRPPSPEKLVPEIESPSENSGDQVPSHPRVIIKRPLSQHRHRQQSRSPSRGPRHRKHGDARASFSPKRNPQRYYHSDFASSEKPLFSRSRATSASRVTSSYSVDVDSAGNFFQTPALPQAYDREPKVHVCVECDEAFPKLAKLKCGHRWCESCLKKRFKASVKDARRMPPKCCTSDIIPLKLVNDLFKDDFKRTWNKRFREFSARNRNYCPRSKCRERIRPEDICHHKNGRTSATCRNCDQEICGVCFNKWHESKVCPAHTNTAHWKRCFSCHAMVELKEGSNQMTCHCGARFCMICEARWKACKCPSFHYDMDDEDELDHVQIPIAMVSRERLGGFDSLPRGPRPGWQPIRDYREAEATGRLQHADADDEDYLDDINDDIGMGNATGHFLNDGYGRSQNTVMPQAPPPAVPLPPPSVVPERVNSGANYVSGVNKARGVRGSSMERRLADRFSEQRQGPTPHHRSFSQHFPSHPVPPLGMVPPQPVQPPMVPSPISRRHTMDNDLYEMTFDPRFSVPPVPRRAAAHEYRDDFDIHAPLSRRRIRQTAPPPPSALAGLTGAGNGMNRVNEWMDHVDPFPPDNQTVA
ncbi:hypothetical protein F4861DRAFT_236736 [Xylaria intraflava]|nr:hypothetical protein F4861DRAFT_236736 [Xylaria intraflava]